MSLLCFYDTETTGLPDWKTPSDSEHQPHIVQIGAVLVDPETRDELACLDLVVRPEGWEIPDEVAEIHGLTTERAAQIGMPEQEALRAFLAFRARHLRVAYNRTFDQRIVRIGLKRFMDEATTETWAEKDDHHCAMLMARPIVGLGKNPTLGQAYEFFRGRPMPEAHRALADARHAAQVYFGALDHLREAD